MPLVEPFIHDRHKLCGVISSRVRHAQRLRKDHHHKEVFLISRRAGKRLSVRSGIIFVQPVLESRPTGTPPVPQGTGGVVTFDHTDVPAVISSISASRSNGSFRVRSMLLVAARTTHTAATRMIASITTRSQLPSAINWLLVVIDAIILVAAVWVVLAD